MKIAISGFRGQLPLIDPRLMPDTNGQVARNVFLKHGTLMPENAPSKVALFETVPDAKSIYHYNSGNNGKGFWLSWASEVDAVKSMLADDSYRRIYWTGDGAPKMGSITDITQGAGPYPSSSSRLGVPAPEGVPGVSVPDRPSGEPLIGVRTTYVVTLISRFGEESAPCLPSAPVVRWDIVEGANPGGEVYVSLPAVPAGYAAAKKRIYRAESSGVFQFVADVTADTASFVDNVASAKMGVALPSTDWDMPDERLQGLTEMPGGFLAGFFDNTLCFSEAYYPHAWPVAYQLAFADDIVGISVVSNGIVVATKGRPHLITGSTPSAMADILIDSDQACIANASIVDMGEYAIYASFEGLVAVGGADAQIITSQVISPKQWRALKPETIHAYRYEGRYLAFYEGGCFSFTQQDGLEFYDITASAGYYDIYNDDLYLLDNDEIRGWRMGDPMTFTWRSKIYELQPGGSGLSCGKVIAAKYPVTIRIFADGVKIMQERIMNRNFFRLPAGYADVRDLEIEVSANVEVKSIQIASSPSELI